jgi:hypothetical protein
MCAVALWCFDTDGKFENVCLRLELHDCLVSPASAHTAAAAAAGLLQVAHFSMLQVLCGKLLQPRPEAATSQGTAGAHRVM